MLVAIIVLFAVCHGPSLIDNVLVSFGYVEQLNYGHLKYIRQAFALMSYFNSCINPVVYTFMSKTFRDSFRYALCVCSGQDNLQYRGVVRFSSNFSNHRQGQRCNVGQRGVAMQTFRRQNCIETPMSFNSPSPSPVGKLKWEDSRSMLITKSPWDYGTPRGDFV